jgi:hypothetical protein
MRPTPRLVAAISASALFLAAAASAADAGKFLSHPPTRPLPVASDRPLGAGPAFYADAAKGNDAAAGSREAPWKTLNFALTKLKPGDTLVLRGGVYYEHVRGALTGAPGKPITLRAHPGELAVIDGGVRELFESPATAWEPCPNGVKGEFQSTRTYPDCVARPDATNVWGVFGDSMVALQGYRLRVDLQSDSMFWEKAEDAEKKDTKAAKVNEEKKVYCGPGVWYNIETKRIHARLAHTNLEGLAEDNYRGETDPRKLPLVVGLRGAPVMLLENSRHVVVQDIVLRGAVESCLVIDDCRDIALEGVTALGGGRVVAVRFTQGFRMKDCAVRGPAAPWTFRSSLKYRAVEAQLLAASGWHPQDNADFDLGYCEFTDSVDGVFIGNVAGVKLHHCVLDNISDDGIFLTAGTTYDGRTPGGNIHIYQNHFSRILTAFAFGVGHGRQKTIQEVPVPGKDGKPATDKDGKPLHVEVKQVGAGVWVCRNVFDFRRWVPYFPAKSAAAPQDLTEYGRPNGDHGSPTWEPMYFYHNLFVTMGKSWRGYYGAGLGMGAQAGTQRRIFNNIFVQARELPGFTFVDPKLDFQADSNLFWSVAEGPGLQGDVFAPFRGSRVFTASKERYEPGWTANDRFADPKLALFDADWRKPVDFALQPGSPAYDAGMGLPTDWPDPLRAQDKDKPDLGPIPAGVPIWGVGVKGRFNPFKECQ